MKKLNSKKLLIPLICVIFALVIITSALFIVSAQDSEATEKEDLLEIFFFPLNPEKGDYNGDSCIITIGDTEILVDGGDSRSQTTEIIKKMQSLISSDNKWDYIIVTHPDSDHTGGFSKDDGIFSLFKQSLTDQSNENKWTLGTLIDFDVSQDKTVKLLHNDTDVTSQITKAEEYTNRRTNVIKYSGAKYYTSSQCCWEARGQSKSSSNGANSEFSLGNGATLHILYNYYYDHRYSEAASVASNSSVDRNNLSVCFLIEYGNHSFLFTGDLEEYNSAQGYSSVYGETKLIETNKELFERVMAQGNGNITFYKVSHHGSLTSSSENFIDYIRPEYVVIPAIAGSSQHSTNEEHYFPATQVCDRFFKYTDKIYIPEYSNENKEALPYFGDINISSDKTEITVVTDNYNDTPIQETSWYKANRNATLYTYTFILPEGTNGVGDCTLLKYGSIDILIDCGVYSQDTRVVNSTSFVDDVKKYCVDGIIEYLIVTQAQIDGISQLIGQYKDNKPLNDGILSTFEIVNLYDFGENTNFTSPKKNGWVSRYYEQRSNLSLASYNSNMGEKTQIANNFYMTILNSERATYKDENDYSLVTLFEFYGKKLLFMGDLTNGQGAEKKLVKNHKELLSNVTYFQPAYGGYKYSSSSYLLKAVLPEYTVITTPLGSNIGGNLLPSVSSPFNDEVEIVGIDASTLSRLVNYTQNSKIEGKQNQTIKKIYATSEGNNIPICGDITFSITVKNNEVTKLSLKGSNSDILLTETKWYKNNNK